MDLRLEEGLAEVLAAALEVESPGALAQALRVLEAWPPVLGSALETSPHLGPDRRSSSPQLQCSSPWSR